ncbi:hypothetical protein F2Q69_00036273 [Brassica cretica]|uniref:Uncharacterized protein n=1 Tax=Brassica cretica TaxID=69181 RepID=A0A8S9SLV1_BRACR|nr:hypothetical protein F2Q69_00036273 [Brassica cretica]
MALLQSRNLRGVSGETIPSGIAGIIDMFMNDLEECGDFGVLWSLLSVELHRRVRCLAMDRDLTTHPVAEVMPVLLKSGQSASQEEAVEE